MGQSSEMEWGVNDPKNAGNNLVTEWEYREEGEWPGRERVTCLDGLKRVKEI